MDVEATSVMHTALTIGECPHLTPFLDQKDKVPHTDGHIDVRSDRSQPKDSNFTHRAYVQVKGRTLAKGRKPQKSFSTKREKLEAYLRIRGVLLFVVYIEKDTHDKHISYSLLTPLELDHMLKQNPKEKSISAPLKPLPEDRSEIEVLVKFMAQAHNENPAALASESLWERAQDISIITSHRIDASKPIRLNPSEHDYTVKLTTEDGAQAFAHNQEILLMPQSYVGVPLDKPIRSGDVVFQEPKVRQVDDHTGAIDLSETLTIQRSTLEGDKGQGQLQWALNDSFDQRLKDLGFLLSAVDNSGYYVGDRFFRWELKAITEEAGLRRHYHHLQRIAELFEFMGARTDLLDLSQLEERRHQQLWHLYDALVEKKEMSPDHPTRAGRILQPLGDWAIELFSQEGSEPGMFRITHLMDPDLQHLIYAHNETDEGPAGFPVTAYEVFKEEGDFSKVLNLGLNRIVEAYSAISEYDHTDEAATHTVLELINAADRAPVRLEELQEAAERLNAWLLSQYGEEASHVVNGLQILYRRRGLEQKERARLRALRRQVLQDEVNMATEFAFSCSVLLGDREEAGDHFDALSEARQEVVRGWPISHLWESPEK